LLRVGDLRAFLRTAVQSAVFELTHDGRNLGCAFRAAAFSEASATVVLRLSAILETLHVTCLSFSLRRGYLPCLDMGAQPLLRGPWPPSFSWLRGTWVCPVSWGAFYPKWV